ncbi:MAG: hydantoinase B/oxoprolinase family protein [Deltaproteobacteria bacterium]|nr:hydantoinase B/oxoprolinase family protein [Deltaproteobacteria bacterium]
MNGGARTRDARSRALSEATVRSSLASEDSGSPRASLAWQFFIDRGGTFTDCIALAPDGALHTRKVLSHERAPVEAIHALLRDAGAWRAGDALPPCELRLGTTVATNALLERRGAHVLLATTRGLGDLLAIGTQERPELFALSVVKPPPLPARVIELPGRIDFRGRELEGLDEAEAREAFRVARAAGLESVAVVGLHASVEPSWEERVAALAREAGFAHVVASSEIAREQGMLARGETAAADAYLTPLLRRHLASLAQELPGAQLRFMQSSGGLTDAARFRGPNALLSGPAGGALGAARAAREAGFASAIGFDMGGTSTDVSLIVNGEPDRAYETVVAGMRVKAPMLRVHTIAAGGGSLCRFDGVQLTVGPESAGADPGPLCYGRASARELTISDANFWLGRLPAERFPFPLQREPVERALLSLQRELAAAGFSRTLDEIAAGFVEIANANMAQAIAQVSIARGVDPRELALVAFGGAAGQHACAVARRLGMRTLLVHPLAGLLSAHGIGAAPRSWDGQRDAGRVLLAGDAAPASVLALLDALSREGEAALAAERVQRSSAERMLDLRYRGAETALTVRAESGESWRDAFEREHRARFGYARARAIEITTARVRVLEVVAAGAASGTTAHTEPRTELSECWFPGAGRARALVRDRASLAAGERVEGPALIVDDASTLVLDPGFRAEALANGTLVVRDLAGAARAQGEARDANDPVRLEVAGSRFMSIAEQMGLVLRNTAVSVNIKERLDYSCAVFDASGGLVANAPHIPVHLGAMGATVRAVLARFPALREGDAIATNDPAEGGSHLPDVTVVTPVFVGGALRFFVASRGHQADIGGMSPGSMPADSRTLEEEGVVLRMFPLASEGAFDEAGLRALLTRARYPARSPDDNVADLEAMAAANRAGARLLAEYVAEEGAELLAELMRALQDAAARKVSRELAKLGDGAREFADVLDDGTRICARLTLAAGRGVLDFSGTSPAVAGNLNAPRAVAEAAAIYALGCLVAERIPLNGGCLAPLELRIPRGSLLDPPRDAAVVAGNVETSQRVVDVILGAMGVAAASQGTMNNLAFGDASFGYYETLGGGSGATPGAPGGSGVHVHMSNTRITDPEVLESRTPVRVHEFSLRRGSGGAGRWRGGEGLVRELEFTAAVTASLITERRVIAPWGAAGGSPGARGANWLVRRDGTRERLPGRATLQLSPGDRLRLETPGGGGWGAGISD